jgi:beta-hydroxylase
MPFARQNGGIDGRPGHRNAVVAAVRDLRYNLPMWWVMAVNLLWWVVLPHRRFAAPAEVAGLGEVARRFPEIRAEFDTVRRTGLSIPRLDEIEPGQSRVAASGRWRTLTLRLFGCDVPHNQAMLSSTWTALAGVEGLHSAMFSVLEPGTDIPTHMGPTKGLWRYHLAIAVPEPEAAGLWVGGTTLRWAEGQAFMFDDTYPHRAWNHGHGDRVVLVCDIVRPMRFGWMNRLNRAVLDRIAATDRLQNAARTAGEFSAGTSTSVVEPSPVSLKG